MTPTRVVLLAAFLGAACVVSGVAGLAGVWWALIATGALVLAACVVLLRDDGISP